MLLIYQIKVGLCLIVFYLLWKLLLSRETFHRFNRVALLVVMALALALPWIRFSMESPSPLTQQMVMIEDLIVSPSGAIKSVEKAQPWNILNIATIAYFVGMVLAFAWLMHSQLSLHRLLKKGRTEPLPQSITLHVLPGEIAPFSYFKHIVISEQDFRDNPREILIHEKAHIRLRHSYDVVFMGLVTLFQWWNPAAWLLCRELRQVHEYEADEAVLNEHVDVKQYQLLLIRKSVGDQLFSMANNFNYQSLKKRIRMMTINKSSRWNRLRALAAVPVIALALLAFANPSNGTNEQATAPSTQGIKVYETVEQMPEFPGGMEALVNFLQENVKYPENAVKNDIEGRVLVQFIVDKTGQVCDAEVVRSVSEELDAEALRVIKSMPNFIPGRQDGKPVAVWFTLPISFKLQSKPQKQEQPNP